MSKTPRADAVEQTRKELNSPCSRAYGDCLSKLKETEKELDKLKILSENLASRLEHVLEAKPDRTSDSKAWSTFKLYCTQAQLVINGYKLFYRK